MNETIRIDIASPPDREKLVAQIMIGDEQWAELNQDGEYLVLEVYPRQDGQPWVISFDDAIGTLTDARVRLIGRTPP